MNVSDSSGYVVFSAGDVGAAHVMAHRLLDSGQVALGHARLGQWLERRTGSGSDWSHIHFHQAIFELEVGDFGAAYSRFVEQILPIAATSQDALTDAPALAWRLAFAGDSRGRRESLPWDALCSSALAGLGGTDAPYVELHRLLALAGAGDADGIRGWLGAHRSDAPSGSTNVLVRMAEAFAAYAQRNYRRAAGLLRDALPELSLIGGSRAQNALFAEMQARAAAA